VGDDPPRLLPLSMVIGEVSHIGSIGLDELAWCGWLLAVHCLETC